MTVKHLLVISGGLGEESSTHRLADSLGKATARVAAAHGLDVRITRVNIRDFAHEIASASLTGYATGGLAQAYEDLADADGVIAVTPTYKASYTGLFKAFWDVTPDGAMSGVPVVVAATGGTARHSLMTDTAMRPLFAYLKALTLPTAVYAAADNWGSAGLTRRVDEAAGELADRLAVGTRGTSAEEEAESSLASAHSSDGSRTLASTRARANDPFLSVPTMEQMLGA